MSDETALDRMDAFDPDARREALEALADEPLGNVNCHLHTFFSYNANGWSPSHIALEARRGGLYAAGICDFDVLDGLEEFLSAGERLGLRATVNLETRAFLAEFSDVEINSPGEPGVSYVMGVGFASLPPDGSAAAETLDGFRERARRRNVDLVRRLNRKLMNVEIDYDRDVLPRTPSGNATERHIVSAYVDAAAERFPGPALAGFWGMVLGRDAAEVKELIADRVHLEEAVRAKLVKRGGIGYVQPSPETFPSTDDFCDWVLLCGAIPAITWLDGTSEGESDPRKMFDCMLAKGAEALNIIPDRNWNVADADKAAVKREKLAKVVGVADELDVPINIGTEMNKPGLPLVDDLHGPVLRRHRRSFLRGTQVFVGHTLLLRFADFGYVGTAREEMPDRKSRNELFASVGALEPLSQPVAEELRSLGREKAHARILDAAKAGRW